MFFFLPATQPGDMKPPAIRAHPKRDVEVSDEVESCVDLTNAVYRLNGILWDWDLMGYNGIQWSTIFFARENGAWSRENCDLMGLNGR